MPFLEKEEQKKEMERMCVVGREIKCARNDVVSSLVYLSIDARRIWPDRCGWIDPVLIYLRGCNFAARQSPRRTFAKFHSNVFFLVKM